MGTIKHPVRVAGRLLWLAGEITLAAASYLWRVWLRRDETLMGARTRWLQHGCRRVLRVLNAEVRSAGPIPSRGLLVSNHLSYLDILALSSLTPSIFVAKREVKGWPIFGWFARLGGTLFADRERRLSVGEVNRALHQALGQGALAVLFPEGTSSDGRAVLPFKSSLLEPATDCDHPLFVSRIEYRLRDGDVGEEVCYWKDMTFVPHLLNLMSKQSIAVSVRFSEVRNRSLGRKELARQLHAEVAGLGALSAFALAR